MTLSEKYPNEYFNHCLAMFIANNSEINENLILEHIEMYKTFEGEEEFSELKKELNLILENNDLESFIKLCADFDCKFIEKKELLKMVETIIEH